ncbi:TPA: hypothetical protein JI217_15850 [Acinetobacter baumannii]|nr:hypothetical protein ACINNAV83_3239 [Acinetobacter baumannii Naval-83]KJX74265.1 hypothetical protein WH42_00970 [Acinetobacter baumannii]OTK78750.1 hypothetical protein B9X89_09440 [Acinetobacter baumannii]OTM56247.1 hypothetical protein B9X38_11935 [Acinetobacter baumannii]OTS87353.1 hypothetical protein CAS92_08565 [Acinetobacter baumannii]
MKKKSLQLLVVIFTLIISLILCTSMSKKSFESVNFSIVAIIGTVIVFALLHIRYNSSFSSGSIFPLYSQSFA